MATRRSHQNFTATLMDLNIFVALLLAVFTVSTLVMTGLAIQLVEFMTDWRFLPASITLLSLVGLFLASGTRDANRYHPAEKVYIGAIAVFAVLFGGFEPFTDAVLGFHEPMGGILVFFIMVVAAAILMR